MATVRLFEDSNALDSLRNSDFDAVSAYGEVVDNAIEAGAKKVRVQGYAKSTKHGYEHIERLVFGDDGHGMDADTLHQCLMIGWSSRYNERSGIGRFGVGMTMAAIHECKRVEVYSKERDGKWLYTYVDLDEVTEGKMDKIPKPVSRQVPKECRALVGKDSGTLVVWSKYDRQAENFKKLRKDAIVWMGRTYRYFIWDEGVEISVDGEIVHAIDPLYVRTEQTKFPDDPPAELFDDIEIEWKVDPTDVPKGAPDASTILVRMSLLDESFRPSQGAGSAKATRDRHIDMNEGISILRNRREVFYGHVPYWNAAGSRPGWSQFQEIDRWWGCEIQFDAILDRAFTVKNIKRGAVPSKELKTTIKDLILPTRETCLERVREVWKAVRQKKREEEAEKAGKLKRPGGHEGAERTAKETPTDSTELDSKKDFDSEAKDFVTRMGSKYDDEQRAALKALFESQPFTILEDTWKGPQFFESNHLGGRAVLRYNLGHTYFQTVYSIIDNLEECDDPRAEARKLRELLDILLIAYARGEARFPPEDEMTAENFVEYLRANWGQYLNNYVRTWLRREDAE